MSILPGRRVFTGTFILKIFKWWEFREGLRKDINPIVVNFPVCPFRVMVSNDWPVPEQGVSCHCSWSWRHQPGFAAFLGLELKYN